MYLRKRKKTIGVLTSGGDAPGMNAAIRAVVRCAIERGYQAKGILHGYKGLIEENIQEMTSSDVANIIHRGGTMLYTARCKEMLTEEGVMKARNACIKHGIDILIVIGGDGTFRGAEALADAGQKVICIPATIDLDVSCTEYTIGFDSAADTCCEAIDKVRDTSTSHERCSIIEVMGRNAGYLALWCGISSGAEDILIPEMHDYNEQNIIEHINYRKSKGKKNFIIINAEGVGDSNGMAKRIEEATGVETRATILGYMQRGGNPSSRDRVMGSAMGYWAVDLADSGEYNKVVAYQHGRLTEIDIKEANRIQKEFPKFVFDIAMDLTRNQHMKKREENL